MNFTKWFFSEIRWIYYFAIIMLFIILRGAYISIPSFIEQKWTIYLFTFIIGTYITLMVLSIKDDYKRSKD